MRGRSRTVRVPAISWAVVGAITPRDQSHARRCRIVAGVPTSYLSHLALDACTLRSIRCRHRMYCQDLPSVSHLRRAHFGFRHSRGLPAPVNASQSFRGPRALLASWYLKTTIVLSQSISAPQFLVPLGNAEQLFQSGGNASPEQNGWPFSSFRIHLAASSDRCSLSSSAIRPFNLVSAITKSTHT
jgi:hypothetical protein